MSKCGLGWPALVVMTVGCGGKKEKRSTFNVQRSTFNCWSAGVGRDYGCDADGKMTNDEIPGGNDE
jgi:hypothetical protein